MHKYLRSFKLFVLFTLFVTLFSLVSCAPDELMKSSGDSFSGTTAVPKGNFILELPSMSKEDIDDLQEIIVKDNGSAELVHLYLEDIASKIFVKPEKAVNNAYLLCLDLEPGTYNISVEAKGLKGNGFALDSTHCTIHNGGEPIVYTCKEKKAFQVYLDARAFIPYWMDDFITITVTDGRRVKETQLLRYAPFVDISGFPDGTLTCTATLSDAAIAMGYEVEYEETINYHHSSSVFHPITIINRGMETSGKRIHITFDTENSCFNFFKSFSYAYPIEGHEGESIFDPEFINNTYYLPMVRLPESGETTVFAPNDLNFGGQLVSWNCYTECGERTERDVRHDNSEWTISTSSKRGQTSWVRVHLPVCPAEMLEVLSRVDLRLGSESIGGWSDVYIPSQLSFERTDLMPVTPGKGMPVSSNLRVKDGMTLSYDLVPTVDRIDIDAGYKYDIYYQVVEK